VARRGGELRWAVARLARLASRFLRRFYPIDEAPMEINDIFYMNKHNLKLLKAAQVVFGQEAHSVWTSEVDGLPSEIRDQKGVTIAFGWFDGDDGLPVFKPWCSRCQN
jgi:hypothetical protein